MHYDPKQAYYERLNPVQKRGLCKIMRHKFSESIGGCAANYRY